MPEGTIDHLLFRCRLATFGWCWIRDSLGWDSTPVDAGDFESKFTTTLGGSNNRSMVMIMATNSWALWRTRNDLVFSNHIIKSLKEISYKILGFLQHWKNLLKGAQLKLREGILEKLKGGLSRC